MAAPILLTQNRAQSFWPVHRKRLPWKPRLTITIASLLLFYSSLAILKPPIRITESLCTKCGIRETTTEECWPFTSIAMRSSRTDAQTNLSIVVEKHQLQLFHRHQFVVVRIQSRHHSSTGPAASLTDRVGAPHARFIDSLATHFDPWTTEKWLDRILDPNRSFPWLNKKLGVDPPPRNPRKFAQWWEGFHAGKIDQHLHGAIWVDTFSQPTGYMIWPEDQD